MKRKWMGGPQTRFGNEARKRSAGKSTQMSTTLYTMGLALISRAFLLASIWAGQYHRQRLLLLDFMYHSRIMPYTHKPALPYPTEPYTHYLNSIDGRTPLPHDGNEPSCLSSNC